MTNAAGLAVLSIEANVLGNAYVLHPTLLWDQERVILVDTGFPGLVPEFRRAMENAGVPFEKLNTVILTHHDIDHIGSLAGLRQELPHPIMAMAHKLEKPYVEGTKQPLKVAQLQANLNALPESMKTTYEKLKAAFDSNRTSVDATLIDGEELPYCDGIVVIHTPGHTLGHVCLYLKKSKTLIAGDALEVENGRLIAGSAALNYDPHMAKESLKKLAKYDVKSVVCYHGGVYEDHPRETIAALSRGDA